MKKTLESEYGPKKAKTIQNVAADIDHLVMELNDIVYGAPSEIPLRDVIKGYKALNKAVTNLGLLLDKPL